MRTKSSRIQSYEVIRVIAIFGVVFYHLNAKMPPYGYLGVVTLFVLAGYLSFHQILIKRPKPIVKQLLNKWKKLYPPLVIMIGVVSVVMMIVFPNFLGALGHSVRASILGLNNYQQILAGDSYFHGQLYLKPFTHLWAITLELQFYLVFILGVSTFYSKKDEKQWSIGLGIFSIASFIIFIVKVMANTDPTPAYYGFESRLFSFSIGMLAYQYTPYLRRFKFKRFTSLITLILLVVFYFKNTSNMPVQMLVYTLLVSVLLMASFYETTILKSFSETRIIKGLSKRSYFLYLWHYPIIEIMIRLFSTIKMNTILLMLIILIVSFVVTEVFYQLHQRFNKKLAYHGLTFLLSIVLLLTPFKTIYNLRADDSFKQLETSLTQEGEEIKKPVDPEPVVEQTEVIELSPTTQKEDFQESFISYFDQLNQISPDVNYSFEDFLTYREIPVTLIGDSVAFIAQPHFESYLPNIVTSAEKSRLLEEVDQYYFQLKKQNKIREIVILSFGTNAITETDEGLIKIWEDLKGKPMIILDLVMPYPVNEESRNEIIHHFVNTHENVYLASWYDFAKSHAEFFAEDYMHPNDLGSRAFIHMITDKVIEIAKLMETNGKLKVK